MTLHDNGQTVTLDLHGASILDAPRFILKTIRLAAQSGRKLVWLIHGSSTSSGTYRNKSIKHVLYDMIDDGELDEYTTDEWYDDNFCILSLPISLASASTRIMKLSDIM